MRRRRRPHYRPSHDRWLISYADYVTLLLALFVVLYAMSTVDMERIQSVVSGMRTAFVDTSAAPSEIAAVLHSPGRSPKGDATGAQEDASDVSYVLLRDRLEAMPVNRKGTDSGATGMRIHRSDRGLVISLAAKDFFHPGETQLLREALDLLSAIGSVLALSALPVRIEGHTDNTPIHTSRFPSNWELSTARASAVARHLIQNLQISPHRIGASGYAGYHPIAPNDTPENRALNRRIDIVVLKPAQAVLEQPESNAANVPSALETLLDQLAPVPEETLQEAAAL